MAKKDLVRELRKGPNLDQYLEGKKKCIKEECQATLLNRKGCPKLPDEDRMAVGFFHLHLGRVRARRGI